MVQNTYNSVMCTTTIIRYPEEEDDHATGFFYNYNNETFLIANRHVIEQSEGQNEEISIWVRDFDNIESTNRIDIPLYDEKGNPEWLINPVNPKDDIAALPINQNFSHINDSTHKTGSLAVSSEAFADPELLIRGGTSARAFGYPEGYVDTNSYFPVARSGMIASPYGYEFEDKSQFLLDGTMGGGMSGSPVFTQRSGNFETVDGDSWLAGATSFLIGVHCGDYHSPSTGETLNLNHTTYAEDIELLFVLNGLYDGIDAVEYHSEDLTLAENIEASDLEDLFTELTTPDMFDPRENTVESPVEDLEDLILAESDVVESLVQGK